MTALRHCGRILRPAEAITFSPQSTLLLDVKVKYRRARVSLSDSFQSVTHFTYICKGTCAGIVYAWQGINYEGETGDLEKIGSKDYPLWASLLEGINNHRRKGASSVSGSLRAWPYTFSTQIPVY